jgi:hypothetical protein
VRRLHLAAGRGGRGAGGVRAGARGRERADVLPDHGVPGGGRSAADGGAAERAARGEQCRAVVCAEDEIHVPSRLPHQTRCDKAWPRGGEVAPAFARQGRAGWAGPEANLLSEGLMPEGLLAAEHGFSVFASFENTLLTLARFRSGSSAPSRQRERERERRRHSYRG